MTRDTFHQELQVIKEEALLLGSMVEEAVMRSVDALRENDLERSRLVIVNDQYINRKRLETENTIVVLMATQHPVARDLRTLASSLEICPELERIAITPRGSRISTSAQAG